MSRRSILVQVNCEWIVNCELGIGNWELCKDSCVNGLSDYVLELWLHLYLSMPLLSYSVLSGALESHNLTLSYCPKSPALHISIVLITTHLSPLINPSIHQSINQCIHDFTIKIFKSTNQRINDSMIQYTFTEYRHIYDQTFSKTKWKSARWKGNNKKPF